jgi:hypothetical protein
VALRGDREPAVLDERALVDQVRDVLPCSAAVEVTSSDGWAWATAEGTVTLTGPGTDPQGPEVEALVGYYRSAAGEHPDWDEYRTVMVSDRRVLMAMTVDHVYGERIR